MQKDGSTLLSYMNFPYILQIKSYYVEGTMHEKPFLIMLLSAKQETSQLLGEDAENRQARQMIMRRRSTEQLKRSHLKTDRCKIER